MKTTVRAIICGVITEAIAASFIVIDSRIGVAAGLGEARDNDSLKRAMQAAPHVFHHLAYSTHWTAVVVLSIVDEIAGAILGLSGGKPIFFEGFGTGNPAWGLICVTQAFIWIAFWALVFAPLRLNNSEPIWKWSSLTLLTSVGLCVSVYLCVTQLLYASALVGVTAPGVSADLIEARYEGWMLLACSVILSFILVYTGLRMRGRWHAGYHKKVGLAVP
jgi:hypothetical protein